MGIRLIGVEGPLKGKMRELKSGTYRIGRAPDCDVRLDNDGNASRSHAILHVEGTTAEIKDTNSTNGTYINSRRTVHEWINEGDTLKIGDSVFQVRFCADAVDQEVGGNGSHSHVDDYHEPEVRYAGFWARVGASIIDNTILYFGSALLIYCLWSVLHYVDMTPGQKAWWDIIFGMIVLAGRLAYFGWLDGTSGQTIGRKAVGIWLTTEDRIPVTTYEVIVRCVYHTLLARVAPFLVAIVVGFVVLMLSGPSGTLSIAMIAEMFSNVYSALPCIAAASTAFSAYYVMYYIMLAADPEKRGWHDKLAGTVVLQK